MMNKDNTIAAFNRIAANSGLNISINAATGAYNDRVTTVAFEYFCRGVMFGANTPTHFLECDET